MSVDASPSTGNLHTANLAFTLHAAQVSEPARQLFPKGPVFGWDNFKRCEVATVHTVEALPHRVLTTSGRAAIYQALMQLKIAPGSTVLVPTYHCPTMVAPLLHAKAIPAYFGITVDGMPDLDGIDASVAARAAAILVPHYFGLPRSLAAVRAWCDHHGVALIEDCAHSLFGEAGERGVGAWGDYATASLSKFLPLPEAGLLASARHPLTPLALNPRSLKAQLKGFVDVLETSARFDRLAGLNRIIQGAARLKRGRGQALLPAQTEPESSDEFMVGADMQRIHDAPLWASTLLAQTLPRNRVIARRQENYQHYAEAFQRINGGNALMPETATSAAPYVFPLWVEDADRVYHTLRLQGYPIFRWDRPWPGTPQLAGDVGLLWSRHVLQLLCHQDLSIDDVTRTADAVRLHLPQ